MGRATVAPMFSQGYCHVCGWEAEREENGYTVSARLAREHVAANPTHTVYVEQARLVVYQGAAAIPGGVRDADA